MAKQVVTPRIRGFIAVNAHPDGCAANVRWQVGVAQQMLKPSERMRNWLVVGSSTGYGLASLICAAFGLRANVLGVCLERESSDERTGSAGWYNLAEAHRLAREQGLRLRTVNGDAFSHEVKRDVVAALRGEFGPLDAIVYSLAAPRRKDPDSEQVWQSALKPVGAAYSGKVIDQRGDAVVEASMEAASAEEIVGTTKVMGGEDWELWVRLLHSEGLLSPGCRSVAFSYVGPEVTHAIYRSGTIGHAKEDLEAAAKRLHVLLADGVHRGGAWVSVNKAVVTQAAAAIPSVALYMSILFKVMKARGTHEGPIEQIARLFRDHLGRDDLPRTDQEGRIRIDDLELEPAVQAEVSERWARVSTANLHELSDYAGYKRYFEELFGFSVPGIDYAQPTEVYRELV